MSHYTEANLKAFGDEAGPFLRAHPEVTSISALCKGNLKVNGLWVWNERAHYLAESLLTPDERLRVAGWAIMMGLKKPLKTVCDDASYQLSFVFTPCIFKDLARAYYGNYGLLEIIRERAGLQEVA